MTQLGATVANDELSKREREIREDIVRRALMGLEDDLDDLRDELGAALEDFEGRIRDRSAALPEWLELDPAEIRDAYRISAEGLQEATIGPRLVAVGAASVEGFIHDWIGQGGEVTGVGLEENSEEIGAAREAVFERLESIEVAARDTALDADARLSELLDAILAELDEKREEDAAALRQLVGSGDVAKGGGARQEIADLWEEQRARAADLRATWEPLERLIFEGVDYTVEGVSELRGFMERADFALRGGVPESGPEIDEVSDTIPAPLHDNDEEDARPGHLVESGGRTTEPMETVGTTNPYLRKPRRSLSDESSAVEEDAADAQEGQEESDGEVGDTEKMDVREIEELAETSRVEESEAEVDAPSENPESRDTEDFDLEEGSDASGDEALEEDFDLEEDSSEDEDLEPAGDSDLEESSDLDEDSDLEEDSDLDEDSDVDDEGESVQGEGFRVIARWDPIPAVERFWGLGLPMGILAALAIPATLNILPVSFSVVNPLDIWPWLFPWGFIVIVAWMLIFMILRHWRPIWRGWRMNLTQWREHRESVDIAVDARGIRLGGLRYGWQQIDAEEGRWESRPDGTFGWVVRVDTRAGEMVLAASERNYTRWEQSRLPVENVPDDVWQVNLVLIQELRKHLKS